MSRKRSLSGFVWESLLEAMRRSLTIWNRTLYKREARERWWRESVTSDFRKSAGMGVSIAM